MKDTDIFDKTKYQELMNETRYQDLAATNRRLQAREHGKWPNIIIGDIGYEFVPLTIYPQFQQLPKSYRYRSPHRTLSSRR